MFTNDTNMPILRTAFALMLAVFPFSALCQRVDVSWDKVEVVNKTTPTLQVVVNPPLRPGSPVGRKAYAEVKRLGAEYVRYVPWLPYPKLAVAELEPPANGKTSWDFSLIDPMTEDFLQATDGHSVIVNFSTTPAWMWVTPKPVDYPSDPEHGGLELHPRNGTSRPIG